jgi:hypothetical protein
MWSSYDGKFKILDFGLTFHTDEQDLHQIQSAGKGKGAANLSIME